MKYLLLFFALISATNKGNNAGANEQVLQLVGSTPAAQVIKSIFGINPSDSIDFMRWDLRFLESKSEFELNLHYGLSKPNTRWFMQDSIKLQISGSYSQMSNQYILTSKSLNAPLYITRISDNIYHILSPEKELLAGDGGWSFTLNRKSVVPVDVLHHLSDAGLFTRLMKDSSTTLTYVGRTPCEAISEEQQNNVSDGCFKLKWKLVLYKDPITHAPSRYELFRTDSRDKAITGKWRIAQGLASDPGQVVYELDPGNPVKLTRLLLGDEDVLFVLKSNLQPFTGNADFSYTLNRK